MSSYLRRPQKSLHHERRNNLRVGMRLWALTTAPGCPGVGRQKWSAFKAAKVGSKVERPILVTGAAGRVGAVGRSIVELLRQRGLQVRALVRRLDERADALHATGAEVVVGDLRAPITCARMQKNMVTLV